VSSLERRLPPLLTAAFVLAAGFALVVHEPWRDEMQAWLLARDSRTPLELIRNLAYEGHPGLWHLLLMPIARLSASPLGMQIASLVMGAATVWVVAALSPFTSTQKVLFAFGYFPLYEYTALSRSYGLGLLLLFLACALFRVRFRHPAALATTLFLACHTSVHAMVVAAGVGVAFAVDLLSGGARRLGDGRARPSLLRRGAIVAIVVALVVIGAASVYWHLAPVAYGWFPQVRWDGVRARMILRMVIRPFLPLTIPGPDYWDSPLIDHVARPPYRWKLLTGGGLLATTTLLLVRRPRAALAYVAAVAGLLYLIYATHSGSIRHHGFLFLAFVVACWLAEDARRVTGRTDLLDRARSGFLTALLLVQAVAAALAVAGDVRYEFSAARRTAAFLQAEGLAEAAMVVEPDFLATGLLGFLEKDRAFYPRGERWGSFIRWDEARLEKPSDDQVLAHVAELSRQTQHRVVLVLGHPLTEDQASSAGLEGLGSFTGDVIEEESFFLYATRSPH
jgi:hypothetical protein